jgi:ribonuclease PH
VLQADALDAVVVVAVVPREPVRVRMFVLAAQYGARTPAVNGATSS